MSKRTIFKYTSGGIGENGEICFHMPANAKILHFDFSIAGATLWAIVDPEAPIAPRRFRMLGTGHYVPELPLRYVKTVFEGLFVWHIFEELPFSIQGDDSSPKTFLDLAGKILNIIDDMDTSGIGKAFGSGVGRDISQAWELLSKLREQEQEK